jgi:hypothetical protein
MTEDRSTEAASAELAEAWAAIAEVSRQLEVAVEADVRLDLTKIKLDLRDRIAELAKELKPPPMRDELEAELRTRERQINELFSERINTMTQTAGDGASPGGYGAGAREINAAIDQRHNRAEIEHRIAELREAIASFDDSGSSE